MSTATMPNNREWLTTTNAASRLGKNRTTILRWANAGEIPSFEVNGRLTLVHYPSAVIRSRRPNKRKNKTSQPSSP